MYELVGGVFINYRGTDSRSYAALLYREFSTSLGQAAVFLDSESIPAGHDFVQRLLESVRQSKVLLAVIGSDWLGATDNTGRRLIDRPDDWIRREIAEAFAAGVLVVPILTDDAGMPGDRDLPQDIRQLARCQFRRLRHRDATADLDRIAADIAPLDPRWSCRIRTREGVPRALPAPPHRFVGRAGELARLTDLLGESRQDDNRRPAIAVVSGAGGMGKTWLSTHWAHQHSGAFPDGQLFVDLRGFNPSGEPATATDVLRTFLELLAVPRDQIPESETGRVAMYRSLTADRQLLVVLDNAADTAQVAPLIPGGRAFVIVTSRRRLTGLAARYCARAIELDILDSNEAREVLTRDIGTERLVSAAESIRELQKWCAGLPLALATMAARIAVHADFPLAAFADELRDHASRLDAFDTGESDTNLRSIISWSYHALSGRAARLFGLLGIAYGPDIGLHAVASLGGMPVERARTVLAELEVAHLIQQHRPCRYRMHDLVRLYATDEATRDQPPSSREAALRRLTEYYLQAANTASRALRMH